MLQDRYSDIEIEEVMDYVLREAVRLKKVCDVFGFATISATLELAAAEANRVLSREPGSEVTEH